jgi:hypothetical protein
MLTPSMRGSGFDFQKSFSYCCNFENRLRTVCPWWQREVWGQQEKIIPAEKSTAKLSFYVFSFLLLL